jgi:hypothetical protein
MAAPRKYIRKSVFIGLGGTGRDAVLHLKRHMISTYGEVPPTIKLLVIDTVAPEQLAGMNGKPVELEGAEFFRMAARDVTHLIRQNREVRAWFSEKIPARVLVQGAAQVRPLGRVALYANAMDARSRIRQVINSARDIDALRQADEKGYELEGEDVQVNFIFSLSGGTGGGTWFDLAYYAREQLGDIDSILAWVLMPDVFTPLSGTRNVIPNFYAGMKELDHYMGQNFTELQSVSFGGSDVAVQGQPFDYVYLINSVNENGLEYQEVSELTEIIGYGLFLTTTVAGKRQGGVWDNIRNQLGHAWDGKGLHYLGFGIGEVTYRADLHADSLASRFVRELIRKGLRNGLSEGVEEEVESFLVRAQLRAEDGEVLERVLGRGEVAPLPALGGWGRGAADAAKTSREGWVAQEEARLRQEAGTRAAEITQEAVAALEEQVATYVRRTNGLEFARNFLLELTGKLKGYQQRMNDEREAHRFNLRQRFSRPYEEILRAMREAEGRLIRRDAGVREQFEQYRRTVSAELEEHLEVVRRERAIQLFAELVARTDAFLDQLRRSSELLDSVVVALSQEEGVREAARRVSRPYSIEIPPSVLGATMDTPVPDADDFVAWLGRVHSLTPLSFGRGYTREGIRTLLLQYAKSQPWHEAVLGQGVEDVLRRIKDENPDELVRLIEMMDQLAVPMWNYNRGLVSGERTTEIMYVFGVKDAENTVLNDSLLQTRLSMSSRRPAFASTKDPYRIVMLKVRAALPAFVLRGMDRYRESYRKAPDRVQFHLHRDWADPQNLPDLFPSTGEENRRWWSLAHAEVFGPLIEHAATRYVLRSKKFGPLGKSFRIVLDSDRVASQKKVLGNTDWIQELREEIEEAVEEKGRTVVARELERHRDRLVHEAGRVRREDLRALIEGELVDIQTYLDQLTTI